MRHLRQFFDSVQEQPLVSGGVFTLSKADSHHVTNVLRLKRGDELVIVQPDLKLKALTCIEDSNQASVACRVLELLDFKEITAAVKIVCAALCKAKKNDFIVEKATELGASTIVLFSSEHSEFKFHGEQDQSKKVSRWQSIIKAACQQSKRDEIPELKIFNGLKNVLLYTEQAPVNNHFVLSLQDTAQPIHKYSPIKGSSLVFIGPEGDFSDSEYSLFTKNELRPLSLGPLVLRSETAVVAGIASIAACSSH